jgi:deazaflavin-dependent oxidoreductase (nitroreductase family)
MADDWNTNIINEFRANGGKVGGQFDGAPMVVLTTTGAKSGQRRVIPLMYLPGDAVGAPDRIYIFASKAGAPTSPDWYHNLLANPVVSIEVGTDSYEALAEAITGGPERDRIYAEQVKRYPGFGDYEKATTRVIPVVSLVRK